MLEIRALLGLGVGGYRYEIEDKVRKRRIKVRNRSIWLGNSGWLEKHTVRNWMTELGIAK